MMRLLAAAALTVASLFVVAAPAAAAPPRKVVESGCVIYTDEEITLCITLKFKVKETITPSGNHIYYFIGTEYFETTDASGAKLSTWTSNTRHRFFRKAGEVMPHMVRFTFSYVLSERGLTCTAIVKYKFTNGKVQIDYDNATCTPHA